MKPIYQSERSNLIVKVFAESAIQFDPMFPKLHPWTKFEQTSSTITSVIVRKHVDQSEIRNRINNSSSQYLPRIWKIKATCANGGWGWARCAHACKHCHSELNTRTLNLNVQIT